MVIFIKDNFRNLKTRSNESRSWVGWDCSYDLRYSSPLDERRQWTRMNRCCFDSYRCESICLSWFVRIFSNMAKISFEADCQDWAGEVIASIDRRQSWLRLINQPNLLRNWRKVIRPSRFFAIRLRSIFERSADESIQQADLLVIGGRISVITFHPAGRLRSGPNSFLKKPQL